jgi:AraC-like DNA-binding protein
MTIQRPIFFAALLFPLFFFSFTFATDTIPDTACMRFEYPVKGTIIKNHLCTLSVIGCNDIRSIYLSALCLTTQGADTVINIDTVKKSSCKFFWNIPQNLPDQLYGGIRLTAKGRLKTGDSITVSMGDVFIYNKAAPSRSIILPASPISSFFSGQYAVNVKKNQTTINVYGYWNTKKLHVSVGIADDFFKKPAKTNPAEIKTIVLIDPLLTADPFPSEKTIAVSVPLSGKSLQQTYRKNIDSNGLVFFKVDTAVYYSLTTVKKTADNKYLIGIDIPLSNISSTMPDSMGINILVKMPNSQGVINTFALNGAKEPSVYCPILWPVIHRKPATLLDNTLFIIAISFCSGLLISLSAGFLFFSGKKRRVSFNISELSEDNKHNLKAINDYIEQNITKKDLSVHVIARELSMSSSKCEALIKKCSGLPLKDFINKSRVEIAKERLKCSHSSERTISESCGFKNVDEMRKWFFKYYRSTPHKYRRENQVA